MHNNDLKKNTPLIEKKYKRKKKSIWKVYTTHLPAAKEAACGNGWRLRVLERRGPFERFSAGGYPGEGALVRGVVSVGGMSWLA